MAADDDKKRSCPSCEAALLSGAILCVDCGYVLETGRFLTTDVGSESVANRDLANPYAPPTEGNPAEDTGEFDLDESGVRRVQEVISGSKIVYPSLAGVMCCFPIWIVLLPYVVYLLWSWVTLRQRYNELRFPNSFSPHGLMAVEFGDAWLRLVIGTIAGVVVCILIALSIAFSSIS